MTVLLPVVISRAEIPRHDNAGSPCNSANEADDQKQKASGGGNRRKCTVTEHSSDNKGVRRIIELLKQISEKQGNGKRNDLAPDGAIRHAQLPCRITLHGYR